MRKTIEQRHEQAEAQRRYRANNPLKYTYSTLRNNAKRRGKPFDLTFEEFKAFAIEVDYIKKKGITQKAIHIDRKEEHLGYSKDNIQPMENNLNVKKYLDYRYDGEKMVFRNKINKIEMPENLPF